MEIRENEKLSIYAPLSPVLDKRECRRLFDTILENDKASAIDLKYINSCAIEFIEELKKHANSNIIGIFNIPSDIFVLFNIMKLDKIVKLYVTEDDCENSVRQLINRNLSIV